MHDVVYKQKKYILIVERKTKFLFNQKKKKIFILYVHSVPIIFY